jgi:tetratricopeptide (TPR) repeat protein
MSLLVACCAPVGIARAEVDGFEKADRLWWRGNYEEAAEEYEALGQGDEERAAVGRARCHRALGEYDAAEQLLAAQFEQRESAKVAVQRAQLALDRGDWEAAEKLAAQALILEPDEPQAQWLQAELLQLQGKLDEALAAYGWAVEYYNRAAPESAETLYWIGQSAAQYARWKRLPEQFRFLVNTLYPDALAAQESFWPAHLAAGLLYLEKFNQAEAAKELNAGLVINPRAAELHAAVARMHLQNFDLERAREAIARALAVNAKLPAAHQLQADLQIASFDVEGAVETLEGALKLNPRAEETLGRLAAAMLMRDGREACEAEGSRFRQIVEEVDQRNPRAGEFYFVLATALEDQRQFPDAERYFREAMERMPQLVGPAAGLGQMYMRLGREEEALAVLNPALEADPFHVRVKNQLEVLDVLSTYETVETEHFRLRFDPRHDRMLAHYAAEYLEEVYPKLCGWLGYEPKQKTLFEFFNQAKNTDGHGWFSARMIGVPYIGTVGACPGGMVALASPTGEKHPFNWARVLGHEFVHVINLEQTNYNVPHWFTEALAVWNEGYPRPHDWNQLLIERAAADDLFDLKTINLAFIRPRSGADWQMAYCQAELYVEYLIERFGDEAIGQLLAAFAKSGSSQKAIEGVLEVDVEDFERGYREYVGRVVQGLKVGRSANTRPFAELQRDHEEHPEDALTTGELAIEYLARRDYPTARKLAKQIATVAEGEQLAAYVLARLDVLVGDTAAAVERLEQAIDREGPELRGVNLLAALYLKGERYGEVDALYRLGTKFEPDNDDWLKRRAKLYLLSGEEKPLVEVLTILAERDADDPTIRKKLAQVALKQANGETAARWATEAIQIAVDDQEAHRMLAEARVQLGEWDGAATEFEAAVELSPQEPYLRFMLADCYAQLGDQSKARATLDALLKLKPDYPGAQQMLESLKP